MNRKTRAKEEYCMEKRPILAIMYDFDHTLSPRDMQEYGFIPDLGMEADAF